MEPSIYNHFITMKAIVTVPSLRVDRSCDLTHALTLRLTLFGTGFEENAPT